MGAEGTEIEPPAGSMTPATFRHPVDCSLQLHMGAEGTEIEPPAGSMTPATFRHPVDCSLQLHMGAEGIEPPSAALEAVILPVYYAPVET
jgi:hypothetical protein